MGKNPNPPLDRDALHKYLWERADSRGRIAVHQGELADKLGVTRGTITRVFKEMAEAGRLKRAEALERNVGVYVVTDPATWNSDQPQPKLRSLKWG